MDVCVVSFLHANAHALACKTQSGTIGPTGLVAALSTYHLYMLFFRSFGFPSTRINLSPFTKDFRGGEQPNESID